MHLIETPNTPIYTAYKASTTSVKGGANRLVIPGARCVGANHLLTHYPESHPSTLFDGCYST